MDTYQPGYFFPSFEKDQGGNTHDRIAGCKINVDEEIDLASRYSVMSIPTLILFQGGKEISRLVGVHSKEDILDMLKTE